MRILNNRILDRVNAKYQAKFPNLANSENLLTKTYAQFKSRQRPKFIVNQKHFKDSKDYECRIIQKAFKLKNKKNLTPYDCWILLVSGNLISDDAYLYFLPRLLEHVLEDPINEDLFNSRLKSLDKRNLSSGETEIIERIKIVVDEIDKYWNMFEAKNC